MQEPLSAFPDDEPAPEIARPFELGAAARETTLSAFPDDDPLTSTYGQALTTTPDAAARAFNLRLKTGLPADVIARNLDEVERQAARQDFDAERYRRESPLLTRWLESHPQHLALTRDDLAPLSAIERTLQVGANLARSAAAGPFSRIGAGAWGLMQAGAEWMGAPEAAEVARSTAAVAQHLAARLRGKQAGAGFIEQAIYGGTESLGAAVLTLPVGLVAGTAGAVSIFGASAAGTSYTAARAKGTSVGAATAYGAFDGAVEAATELIPAKWFLKDLASRAGFWKAAAHQAVPELLGEQIATALQDLNEWVVLRPDATFTDYLAERPSAAAQTLIATIVAVGGQSTLVAGLERATGKPLSQQVVEDLHAAAGESKTRERTREAFHGFLEQATKNGLTHVHAPGDTFFEYFQAKGEDPEAIAAELTGNPDALRLARATGGDLAIPTAAYLARMVGTGHETFFAQELRLGPDQRNARETKLLIAAEAEAGPAVAADDPIAASRRQVHDTLVAKLTATQRFTPDDVQTYAALWASVFTAMSSREPGTDPYGLLSRYPTQQIVSEGGVALAMPTAPTGATGVAGGIPASVGGARETPAQATERREGHVEALAAVLVREAQQIDPTVDPGVIRAAIADRIDLLEEQQALEADSGGTALLRAIAAAGGLAPESGGGLTGELRSLRDGATASGTIHGVRHVFRDVRELDARGVPKTGLGFDVMLQRLQESGYTHLADTDALIAAIDAAVRAPTAVPTLPGTDELTALGIKRGTAWWPGAAEAPDALEPADGGDASFDIADFEQQADDQLFDTLGRSLLAAGGTAGPVPDDATAELIASLNAIRQFRPPSVAITTRVAAGVTSDQVFDDAGRPLLGAGGLVGPVVPDDAPRADVFPTRSAEGGVEFTQQDLVATLTGNELGEGLTDLKALRRAAIAHYTTKLQHGIRSVDRPGFGTVTFTDLGKKKVKATNANADKLRLIPAIPAVIVEGTYAGRFVVDKHRADNIVAFHFFTGDVVVGERRLSVAVSVAEDRAGNKFYNINPDPAALQAQKKARADSHIQKGTGGPSEDGGTTLEQSIGPNAGGVNVTILAQGDDQTPAGKQTRGTYNPVTHVIRLFALKNRSTFLHESAHFFLEVMSDLAQAPTASASLTADMATLLASFGFEGDFAAWRALTHEQRRVHHEQFARTFEKFLGEGKAPTPELQPLFARFRAWFLGIYRSLSRLNVEISPEVRKVMERLVATDAAIAAAAAEAEIAPLFTTAAAAGVPDVEFAGYRVQIQAASDEAQATLQTRLLRELAREQERWWQEQRDALIVEVAAEVHQQPVYRALAAMRGTQPDGSALPEGTPATPLSKAFLITQFGRDVLQTLPRPYVYSKDSGLPPDTVAELFGFPSGEALIAAIVAAPPMQALIEQQADDRMLERHGDLLRDPTRLVDAARVAIADAHRATVIRAELRMLTKLRAAAAPSVRAAAGEQRDAARAGAERLRSELPDAATLQRLAQLQIAAMRLRDIRPERFAAAARRGSRAAVEGATKGDFDAAVKGKQDELVNLALFREATAAREAVETAREQFAKMFKPDGPLAKRRNMDYVTAARAIAAAYFFPEKRLGDARDALALMEEYDAELFAMLNEQIAAARAAGPDLPSLTFEAFGVMRDAVDALWEQSIREQQMLINGQLVERHAVVAALDDRFDQLGTPLAQEPRTTGQMYLLGARAGLRRVESWVDYLDGGDPNGRFRRYIWTPVSEATARYRIHKVAYLQQYLDLVKTIETTLVPGTIAAPELNGYVFESRAALLHALLHSGNESNFQKLLRGRKWGTFQDDGSVDDAKWRAFLKRAHRDGLITQADWTFVSAVWALTESVKPEAQEAHRAMYGHRFAEITAWPVATPWGTIDGGYVPAVVDPLLAEDAAARGERQSLTEGDSPGMFPTTGRGFTKARKEAYAKPLALDLRLIPQHLDKVLRFIHLEPTIKDVGRLVLTYGFRERLAAYDPTARADLLMPWLQRAAAQRVSQPGKGWAGRGADAFFRTLRTRTGLNLMAANVINTLEQFTGLSIALTKVQPRYLRNALWGYVRHHAATVEAVQASEFMRTRMTAAAFEIQRTIDDLLLNPTAYEKVRDFGQRHGYFLQAGTQGIVDTITWVGAYEQAAEQGADHAGAVREADSAVRQTQGSFAPEDISRIEAGTAPERAFLMFFGYFNMLANTNGTELAKVARDMGLRKGAGRALYLYTLGFMIPAVLSQALRNALTGDWGDDDDDTSLDEAMALFFGAQGRTLAAMVPGGQVATAALNVWNDKPYDDRISVSPAISTIESAVRAPVSVYSAITADTPKKRAVRDTLAALGLLTGLPVGAVARPAGYLADVYDERETPEDARELVGGLISGRGRPQ